MEQEKKKNNNNFKYSNIFISSSICKLYYLRKIPRKFSTRKARIIRKYKTKV